MGSGKNRFLPFSKCVDTGWIIKSWGVARTGPCHFKVARTGSCHFYSVDLKWLWFLLWLLLWFWLWLWLLVWLWLWLETGKNLFLPFCELLWAWCNNGKNQVIPFFVFISGKYQFLPFSSRKKWQELWQEPSSNYPKLVQISPNLSKLMTCRGIKRKLGAGKIGIWKFGPNYDLEVNDLEKNWNFWFLFQIIHLQLIICGPNFQIPISPAPNFH